MGRREFLQVIGVVGTASFLALANASKGLKETVSTSDATVSEELTTQTTTVEAVNTQTTTNAVISSNQQYSSLSNNGCTVSCQKACSYPGHCHRYLDTNNNGRCDFGECA